MITEEKNALIFKQILSTNSLRKFIEISRENLCKWGSVYISFSIEQVISAPENVVNLYRLCQYFCRFCRLHRSGLINRDVIMILILLPGTTNEYKFSFIFGFQILS